MRRPLPIRASLGLSALITAALLGSAPPTHATARPASGGCANVVWTNWNNTVATKGRLWKIAGGDGIWDAGATVGKQPIRDHGDIRYTVTAPTAQVAYGLVGPSRETGPGLDMDFAVVSDPATGGWAVWNSGAGGWQGTLTPATPIQAGDVIVLSPYTFYLQPSGPTPLSIGSTAVTVSVLRAGVAILEPTPFGHAPLASAWIADVSLATPSSSLGLTQVCTP